jgi:hypothetical protein
MASKLRSGFGTRISFFSFQDIITAVTGILILVTLILTLYLDQSPPVTDAERELKRTLTTALTELTHVTTANQQHQTNLSLLATAPSPERLQADIRELQGQLASQSNRLTQVAASLAAREAEATTRAEQLGLAGLRERSDQLVEAVNEHSRTNETLVAELQRMERQHQDLEARIQALNREHKLWLIPDTTPGGKEAVLVTVASTNVTCQRFNQTTNRMQFPAEEAEGGLSRCFRLWNPERDYLVFYVRPSGIDLFLRCQELAKRAGFQVGYDAVEEDRQLVFNSPAPP